jgi:hypothetical protein
MLVPQNSPCPECSHPRGDHDIRFAAGGGEQCKHCGCTATTIRTDPIFWNPDAPPKPFDWNFALVTFLMELEGDEGLFTDTIERWRPGYELAAGEREELRSLELLVRELWARYSPREPLRADVHGRNINEENAAVDECEAASNTLKGVILRLAVSDEWRSYFPASEHEKIDRARQLIIGHGGTTVWERENSGAV